MSASITCHPRWDRAGIPFDVATVAVIFIVLSRLTLDADRIDPVSLI